MKRVFIVCCAILIALAGRAQSSSWTDPTGAKFNFTIIDPINKLAQLTRAEPGTGVTIFTIPGTIPYNGETYKIVELESSTLQAAHNVKKLILSNNIKVLGRYSLNLAQSIEEIEFPSTLEVMRFRSCGFMTSLKAVDLSNTKVRVINEAAFRSCWQLAEIKLPQSLRRIDFGICSQSNAPVKSLELPAQLDTISYGAFNGLSNIEEITFTKPSPALLFSENPINPSYGPYNPFRFLTKLNISYVPTDATKAYQSELYWNDISDKYREKVDIGSTGYTTYYLENENFKVPTGCTAYIITGVTPSGSITTPDNAIVKAFSAGKIIPKQTGFILQGTPNSTVVYQANVTGIEEDVTGNLLVGTATEREINGAGYKYYVLSNSGDQGLGFYKQGTRGGASIKLKAHRAGLRLTESIARAKSFFIDFDAARENANVAGIRNIGQEAEGRDNVIYDLQGRRVKNPTHGIYIINGKKVIINK